MDMIKTMNYELFEKLWQKRPAQHKPEWLALLEICELYMKKRSIIYPIVVELGSYRNRQKPFWEELFNAKHIGIDISNRKGTPDILGSTDRPETLDKLKDMLNEKPINILFIDASHRYENVKKDFEIYSPLCSDIVIIHDTELGKNQNIKTREVYRFWDELRREAYFGNEKYQDYLFISLHRYRGVGDKSQTGIGIIIKP